MASLDLPRPAPSDSLAGASVALVLIPQSLAYAELAQLPPYIGLYASAFPLLVFSLFASSPYLQTGPTAVMSLLTFAALPAGDPSELPKLAALLALAVGVMRFVFGLARIGVVVRAIALPVVAGFTSGAAILIISSQLPRALDVDTGDGGVIGNAIEALTSPAQWQPQAILLSAVTIALFLGGRKLHPLFPGVLVAVIIGIVWSSVSDYSGAIVGDVPEGLPPLGLDLPWGELPTIIVGAAVIALIGFAEPVSIARTFANEEGQSWDANREFMASGIANAMSAISGGYPVGGSFSRSSVNKLAGAQTRWAGGFTGLVVLAFLPFAGVLEPLPRAVLSAIVLAAVVTLVRPRMLLRLWKFSTEQAALAWLVFGATLVSAPRVERAVIFGMVLTIGLHLWRGLRVEHTESNGATTLTPTGLLWLGTDRIFDTAMVDAVAGTGDVTIDFARTPFVDGATVDSMRRAAEQMTPNGRRLSWINEPKGADRLLGSIRDVVGSAGEAGEV